MAGREIDVQGHSYTVREPTPKAPPQSTQSPAPAPQPSQSNPVTSERSVNIPTPHGNRTVLLAMLVSFGTYALAGEKGIAKLTKLQDYIGRTSTPTGQTGAVNKWGAGHTATGTGSSVFTARAIFGWLTLFVMLTIMADFDATSDLAGAFAMLIMLSTLLTMGPDAFANLTKLTTVPKTG